MHPWIKLVVTLNRRTRRHTSNLLYISLQADGVNTEEWFQWLAAFTGLICRKYPDIELPALLQYLANQLKSSDSLDLLFLKEILTAMTVSEIGVGGLVGCCTILIQHTDPTYCLNFTDRARRWRATCRSTSWTRCRARGRCTSRCFCRASSGRRRARWPLAPAASWRPCSESRYQGHGVWWRLIMERAGGLY